MPYNPFDKPIGEKLIADDLQRLLERNVAEGYYVEYKSDFPANEKIGRSIASFANTYGGWYIVGAKTDEHNVANEICGFSPTTYPDPISKVREIVKSHIDPVPIFYPQVVSLEQDKAVLVVYVPADQETPFISKDGRIYRRTHDSSDPVPETSRYTIDRLVDDGRNIAKRFEEFCREERTFGKEERNQSWVKLFLSPYPLGTIERRDVLSSESIQKLIQLSQTQITVRLIESSGFAGNLPLNSGQPTCRSVILRQIEPARAAFDSLMAEFFVDGRAKFFTPIRYFSIWRRQDIDQLESSQTRETLGKIWEADHEFSTSYLRFFDIGQLSLAVAFLLSYYQEWLGKEPSLTDLKVAVVIEGVECAVPFFDSDEWGNHVKKFSLPVAPSKTITIPQDIGRGLLMSLSEECPLWATLCSYIGLAFGLPVELYWLIIFQVLERAAKRTKS